MEQDLVQQLFEAGTNLIIEQMKREEEEFNLFELETKLIEKGVL